MSIGGTERSRRTTHAAQPERKEFLTAATWKDLEDAVRSTRPEEEEGQTLGESHLFEETDSEMGHQGWGGGAG